MHNLRDSGAEAIVPGQLDAGSDLEDLSVYGASFRGGREFVVVVGGEVDDEGD